MNGWNLVLLRLGCCGLLATGLGARAQWLTQSIPLQPGWNAVFLHVDTGHATLDELVGADFGNPIQEIWLWQPPAGTHQFVTHPQMPSPSDSFWVEWTRAAGTQSPLRRLQGNVACLVRVGGTNPYVWSLKGRPVAPKYDWTSSGLNFLGFPTPAGAPPSFEAFLSPSAGLLTASEIYRYPGGEFGPANPQRVLAFRTLPVQRGHAYWIRSEQFNRYFGPFQVDPGVGSMLDFGSDRGQHRVRLRNVTPTQLVVNLSWLASEPAPAGQPTVVGLVPLLVRGALQSNLVTYGYGLVATQNLSWTLAPAGQPGSEADVVFGVHRTLTDGYPGQQFAGILRFSDGGGLAQVDLGVSAQGQRMGGLWLGEARITEVQHYLQQYERDRQGQLILTDSGRYRVTGVNTNWGRVARPFPLRLILHQDHQSRVRLLQRVFVGFGLADVGAVVAIREDLLNPNRLGEARRLSSTHLPWSPANLPWPMEGQLRAGGSLAATVRLDFNDHANNPFLHTYHPDHDNLDDMFRTVLPRGQESYEVERRLYLNVDPPENDFDSVTRAHQMLAGEYLETITFKGQGNEQRTFLARGVFSLTRISPVEQLSGL